MKGWTGNLPLLSALAVLGTAAGISLGHSAVAEINPLYFSAAPDRFHADQSAQRPDWTAPVLAADAAPVEGLGDGCFGCSPRGGSGYYAAPAVITYTDGWTADAERAAAPAEPAPAEQAAPDPERERLVRYASYPITAEEADAQQAEGDEYAAVELEGE